MSKSTYMRFLNRQFATPQSEPIPDAGQVANSAGGYSFQLNPYEQLQRFLILGSEGGTYYSKEQELTRHNAKNVLDLIQQDGASVVKMVQEISNEGRAPKNTPAIFTLALATCADDLATRQLALEALPSVCRTGSHLFEFVGYVNGLRGWGRNLKRGVAKWYTEQPLEQMVYQAVKYRQREGWSHADVLRLAHVKPRSIAQDSVFGWITKEVTPDWATAPHPPDDRALRLIWGFQQAQTAQTVQQVVSLIDEYDLTREMLPTSFLNEAVVWEHLLNKMPMTAMIRNLGNMSKAGLLQPLSGSEAMVVERLSDEKRLRKARVHPLSVLSALRVYAKGHGLRGQGKWTPSNLVLEALETAFQLAFKTVEPTKKRTLLALDVSGSMSTGMIAGIEGLTPREGSAAMAMVTAHTEPYHHFIGFGHELVPLKITSKMDLLRVTKTIEALPMGGTDCALPMIYARKKRIDVDTFIVYTDSETWYGDIHPVQALQEYRQASGIPARLIVVGMTATPFSIADPRDRGMLDVVGFDSAAPSVMSLFSKGAI